MPPPDSLSGLKRRKLLGLGAFMLLPGISLAAPAPLPRISARHAFAGNFNDTYFNKAADVPVAIASITKLITAWAVLSSDQSLDERIQITQADVIKSEYTKSGLPPGSIWRREQLLEWLLIGSDNRAAAALSRTYPGGHSSFLYAMRSLATGMQLLNLDFGDPAGLSVHNQASARDLAILILTLAQLPWFRQLTQRSAVHGHSNTNRWAHDQSVQLMAGKTGFTTNAGYCLAQAEKINDQTIALVVLQSASKDARTRDISIMRHHAKTIMHAPQQAKLS